MILTNPINEIVKINKELESLLQEDTTNLDLHPKPKEEAEAEIKACEHYLKVGDTNINGLVPIEKIKRIAFLELYIKANDLIGEGNYLTGLKIEFGIDLANNLSLVYKPIRFYNGTSNLGSSTYDKKEGVSFKYNNGENRFDSISEDERCALVLRYEEIIRIKHSDRTGDTHTNFIKGKDIESMIFSFQEIFALMYDNRSVGVNDIFDRPNVNPILFFNYVKKEKIDDYYSAKHSLLLSPNLQPKVEIGILDFKNMYANLAHLCPPNCERSGHVFKLE